MDELRLVDYRPKSKLVNAETRVLTPRFPTIDAHNHLGVQFGGGWDQRPLSELVDVLDQAHVRMLVDLDGGWGEDLLNAHLEKFKQAAPERFQIFGGVDWSRWPEEGDRFGEKSAARLRAQVRRGAQGLKIWKVLGLHVKDQHEKLVHIDDTRLDPVWETAGELKIPVLIHIADPVAFFEPLSPQNERYEEISRHPDWAFSGPQFPPFKALIEQFEHLIARHSTTTFIGAHVGCYPENLEWVSHMLQTYPHFNIDFSARIAELGRQPYSARRLFLRFPDRILFGTDMAPNLDSYRIYYRFLESDDEYFDYDPGEIPGQGRWQIYGLYLPENVLRQVYFLNAERIMAPSAN